GEGGEGGDQNPTVRSRSKTQQRDFEASRPVQRRLPAGHVPSNRKGEGGRGCACLGKALRRQEKVGSPAIR
ncbi:unnamed protein product, partial [Ectocarpus fasciculatus]